MSKPKDTKVEAPEAVPTFVPAMGRTIMAVDQADVEKQVEAAKQQEVGDGDS